MKTFIKFQVNSYFNNETSILLTWIAKSIETPSEELTKEQNNIRRDLKKKPEKQTSAGPRQGVKAAG